MEMGFCRGALVCALGLRSGAWQLGCAPGMEQQPGNRGLLMGPRLLCWKAHGRFVGIGDSLLQKLHLHCVCCPHIWLDVPHMGRDSGVLVRLRHSSRGCSVAGQSDRGRVTRGQGDPGVTQEQGDPGAG